MPRKVIFVGSTGGGVLARLLVHRFVRDMTLEVVSDRSCGFLTVAEQAGVRSLLLPARTGAAFSDILLTRYDQSADTVFLSFYTKLFSGKFIEKFQGRVFNCHPSILPSFPGLSGFKDTIEYCPKFMGCTLHLINAGMDTGAPVIQAAIPLDPMAPIEANRDKIFWAQYYSAAQFLKWVYDDRLGVSPAGRVSIEGGRYEISHFSPNLDGDIFSLLNERDELCGQAASAST